MEADTRCTKHHTTKYQVPETVLHLYAEMSTQRIVQRSFHTVDMCVHLNILKGG